MLKKTIALMLALVLAVSLCACETVLKPFTPGTVANNHYESTYAGVACQLDSDWTFMTDEQIRQNNEQTMDMMGEDYAAALEKATVITDMFATHANQMDTVHVSFEKLSGVNMALTAEAYAQISAKAAADGLTAIGVENATYEIGKIQFAGSEHTAIRIEGVYAGISVYETIALRKTGNYMMLVASCTWYENTTEAVLANFTKI